MILVLTKLVIYTPLQREMRLELSVFDFSAVDSRLSLS